MFQTNIVEKIKSRRLRDNVKEYFRARQATDGNMANARCMLDTEDYRHSLKMRNAVDWSLYTCLTQLYGGIDMYNLLHK